MPRVRFQPLIISKRRWRGPWFPSYSTTYADEDYHTPYYDVEKREASDWEDASHASSSANSSRVSSASYDSQETLLDRRKRPRKPASAYGPRKQCNLYFTVILGGVLILFVLVLFTLHKWSAAEVSSGVHKPEPKPPPWHEFSPIDAYWKGLQDLVGREEWRPAYPSNGEESKKEIIDELEEEHDIETERGAVTHSKVSRSEDRQSNGAPEIVKCYLDEKNKIEVPRLRFYDGLPQGFPEPIIGSNDPFAHNTTQCLDRYRRFGPYGFGYKLSEGGTGAGTGAMLDDDVDMRDHGSNIDYNSVRWAKAQHACSMKNSHRFEQHDTRSGANDPRSLHTRSAILIKVDADHQYTTEELLQLRALISEAALATGALFAVHFLIRIGNELSQIWADKNEYDAFANDALPQEFCGMGTLWSEDHMKMIYAGLGDVSEGSFINTAQGAFLPVQHFAHQHAEYEHFWVWDLSARYTGHIGALLSNIDNWALEQPRKEIWERNVRFYVPTEHGSWQDFLRMTHVLAEHGPPDPFRDFAIAPTTSTKSVWGPRPADDTSDPALFVEPPSSQPGNDYRWGMYEPADLVSLSPIFDPSHVSSFSPANDFSGYNTTDAAPPRRATTSTILRLSRRLLLTMHAETAQRNRYMAPEMWPASVALHYGLKAVYAPHAMYVNRRWPTDYFAAVMNTGSDGGVVSGRSSVFGDARRQVFEGLSYGASSGQGNFARGLWRRWFGYRDEATGEGGEEWEDANTGRMCLPPMLLSGVGRVDLVVEEDE